MAGPTEPARRDGRLTGVVTDTTALTPEARAHLRKGARHQLAKLKPGPAAIEVVKRAGLGVFNDGFIHAGNLAYLALMTVFPFFITAAAVLSLLGQSAETQRAVSSFLHVLPPNVADILRKPIADVLVARTGSLLWLGGLVGLWTVGSFVETIRDIFHRAYGVKASVPFWRSRLSSSGVIILSVIIALMSFLVQGILTAAACCRTRATSRLIRPARRSSWKSKKWKTPSSTSSWRRKKCGYARASRRAACATKAACAAWKRCA